MPTTINEKQDSSEEKDHGQDSQAQVREPTTLILPDNNKLTSYLFSTFRRSTNAVLVLLLVAAIPLTLILISRQQDVRQRAGFEPTPDITKKYNISGKIYIDTNNNKARDSWENGPSGAVVAVNSNNVKVEAASDSFGNYSFEKYGGLLAGSYTVTLSVPDTYIPITASTVNIKLGPQNAIVDFGVERSTNTTEPRL
jgi:hypothetical protein